ncbi:c-type cytochrome [Algoriphagus terrigena]|uniref:c-type cytochrome n=1 Tax=Algoriphagus terrigena TaxID=344884 RepID=UPI0004243D1A|nr:cytochrome c [Algoriphagus terrigena]
MIKKLFLIVIASILTLGLGLCLYILMMWDKQYDIPYPDLKTSTDSTVIARGKYLVHGPAHCSNCHVSSIPDMIAADAGEPVPLKGGAPFHLGPLAVLYVPNLTPDPTTGIGRYSDGQVFRMMRHAVRPSGIASISLLMPFWNMADEDLVAVVSYLRSMEPIENEINPAEWSFLGKAIRVFVSSFQPIQNPTPPKSAPPMLPTIERGEYLARSVANCVGCHTQRDPMTFEATGPEYAGGMEFEPDPEFNKSIGEDPEIWLRTPNLTPDPGSALSKFKTLEEWKARFRQGRQIKVSPMHWGPFSRLSDEDLEALYLYLHSLSPVKKDNNPLMFKPSE